MNLFGCICADCVQPYLTHIWAPPFLCMDCARAHLFWANRNNNPADWRVQRFEVPA